MVGFPFGLLLCLRTFCWWVVDFVDTYIWFELLFVLFYCLFIWVVVGSCWVCFVYAVYLMCGVIWVILLWFFLG